MILICLGITEGIELYKYCGNWKTAYAMEEKGLIEIWQNENRQVFCFLKDEYKPKKFKMETEPIILNETISELVEWFYQNQTELKKYGITINEALLLKALEIKDAYDNSP